jgi:hypothetical protein
MTEMHGGQLKLESSQGQGTTVTILLPAWRIGQKQDNQKALLPPISADPAKTRVAS